MSRALFAAIAIFIALAAACDDGTAPVESGLTAAPNPAEVRGEATRETDTHRLRQAGATGDAGARD